MDSMIGMDTPTDVTPWEKAWIAALAIVVKSRGGPFPERDILRQRMERSFRDEGLAVPPKATINRRLKRLYDEDWVKEAQSA